MPKDFIVIRADHKEDWSGQYGPMKTYSLELEEAPQGSGISHQVEINQKPTTAPPAPGETLSGDIQPNKNPDFPPRFKKAQKVDGFQLSGERPKGGGGFKPRDPAEIAGARHAHSLLVAAHSFTPLPHDADGRKVQERIDNLEAMASTLDEKTKAASDAVSSTPKKDDSSDLPF